MDSFLEIIFFLIIAAFYVLQGLFSKKKPKQEEQEEAPPSNEEAPRPVTGGELLREIREEIRRRSEAPAEEMPPERPVVARAEPTPVQPERRSIATPQPRPVARVETPVPSAQPYAGDQLDAMRRQIEETRKRAELEAQRAGNLASAPIRKQGANLRSKSMSNRSMIDQVITNLRDPQAARKAVLYSEIFGAPVGMRKNGSIQPMWQQ